MMLGIEFVLGLAFGFVLGVGVVLFLVSQQ